ncbi:hypothetical protein AMATHDRAFT_118615, partial [Amanita thiersii Skay4041]
SKQSEGHTISKNTQNRWFALATINMICFGFVMSSFVPLVLFWIFGNDHLRAVWRLSLGLGMVSATAVFIWRFNMEEPVRYRQDSMKRTRIPYTLVIRRYGVSLAAISIIWLLFDFIVYSCLQFGLFASIIINNITGGSTDLSVVFGWNVVIYMLYMPDDVICICIGCFPGTLLGAKWTMIMGLVLQAVDGFIISGLYVHLTNQIAAFAVLYEIFISCAEFGPELCTLLLASKTSSTAVRGHYFGIAAAMGKLGAFIAFPPLIDAFGGPNSPRGYTGPFWVASGLAVLSVIIAYFFVEPLTQDGIEEEDRKFREYLEAHGYDTSQMGFEDTDS